MSLKRDAVQIPPWQPPPAVVEKPIQKVSGSASSPESDLLAVEEPLEIRLRLSRPGGREPISLSVTMRTPGHDFELAAGFLLTEGVVSSVGQIDRLRRCGGPDGRCGKNVVTVDLRPGVSVDLDRLRRHFYTSSSCGVCGKTSLAAVRLALRPHLSAGPCLDPAVVHRLPGLLRAAQTVFDHTGGLHASALFDDRGRLLCLYEDVGRHNALDKLIGSRLLAGELPLTEPRAAGQRPSQLRAGAEGRGRRNPHARRGRGAVQPGRGPGPRLRYDPSRFRPR